ncbi:diguanylate cyclase (GGDEF)-like protein [Anaeroplasma bactoclasticum]|jgi:diguanylate cyclase (GGDEF)-like protein|uniref:Diguanylate cyclase (GGDEF)-like protein n=1 Tax=Anaeroplasma bactoclasticum TaxID=2088 RepID=A0A397R061_9MOLU|nr:GGDEF domain-containing protein [Anaeroplasma bactoclasticum]RIA64827.1 diguanylate cyclase (GGDEF)-like protein [Anaeroplasma bactoclasticum]
MKRIRDDIKTNFIRYTGPILSIVCFFIILIVAEVLNSHYDSNLNSTLDKYETNWVLVYDGKEEEIVFPFAKDYSIKECELKNTLGDVTDNDIILFKYQYQITDIYVGNELIYHVSFPKSGNVSTTMGTNILSITMQKSYSNKEIRIHMQVENQSKRLMIEDIYLCSRGDYLFSIFKSNTMQLFFASLLLITGTIYLIIYVVIKIKGVKLVSIKEEYFLSLFVFSYSAALWVLTDLHLVFIMTGHLVVNDILSYFSLSIVPIGLVYIVYYILKKYKPFFIILEGIYCLNILLQTLFFITGIADIANMLIVTQVLLFSGLFASIVIVILAMIKEKSKDVILLICGFIIFLVLIGICIIGYMFGPIGFDYNLYFLLAMTVLATVFGYTILKEFVLVMGHHAMMERTIKYAYIDALTGIGNRRSYEESIVKEKAYSGIRHLAIVAFDVNYLKESNDNLGHKAGDELLIATANIIKKHLSEGTGANIFRTGGDEFCAIVHMSKQEIYNKINELNNDIAIWKGLYNPTLSIAVGYAIKEDYPDISLEELAIKADEEMYKNKRYRHAKKQKS